MRRLQIGALLALISAVALLPGGMARAAESLLNPLGGASRVIQGYNGGTHQGRSRYAYDLVLAGGGTSGAAVVSPIEGRVAWAMPPGAGNGCIGIALRDGSHSVALCHVLFDQAFKRGDAIARGQTLGSVGAAGTLGNNGTAHVHLEVHRGAGAGDPVPFSAADGGLPLEGLDEPARAAAPQPVRVQAAAAVPSQPAPAAPTSQPAPAAPAPQISIARADPVRAAIISGTESCLNVRATPSIDAAIRTCIPDGTEVVLSSERNDAWWQIADKGWASVEFLKLTRAVVSGTSSCLNVRETPSTSARIVGCLAEGTPLTLAEGPLSADGMGWFKIARDVGGWVASAFLS